MQDLLERYNSLSNYVKEGSLGLKHFVDSLPTEPSETQIDAFRKKVIKGEEIQREKVDVWMPILKQKRDFIQSIKNHPLYNQNRFGKKEQLSVSENCSFGICGEIKIIIVYCKKRNIMTRLCAPNSTVAKRQV